MRRYTRRVYCNPLIKQKTLKVCEKLLRPFYLLPSNPLKNIFLNPNVEPLNQRKQVALQDQGWEGIREDNPITFKVFLIRVGLYLTPA